jgi:hypothetical protein
MQAQFRLKRHAHYPSPTADFYGLYLRDEINERVHQYATLNTRKKIKSEYRQQASVIFNHVRAIEAEVAQQWLRADFFWNELHHLLRSLDIQKGNATAIFTFSEPLTIHDLVALSILPFHCGFYNHYITSVHDTDKKRAQVHFNFIRHLSSAPQNDELKTSVWVPFLVQCIGQYIKESQWQNVIDSGFMLIDAGYDDVELENSIIEAHLNKAMAKFAVEKKTDAIMQPSVDNDFREAIRLKEKFSSNLLVFDLIGQLHYLKSIQLSTAKKLAEALLEINKSLVYKRDFPHAASFRESLEQGMLQLQSQVKQLDANMARNSNLQLTDEGYQMKAQALKGFTLVEKFISSMETETILSDYKKTLAKSTWRRIGLQMTPSWEENAALLYTVLSEALAAQETEEKIKIKLIQEVHLQENDIAKIIIFLFREKTNINEAKEVDQYNPLLATAANPTIPKDPPFALWLLSKQDLNTKITMAAAVIAVLVFLIVYTIDTVKLMNRNTTFAALQEGLRRDDQLTILKNASEFLKNTSHITSDDREPLVVDYYDQAMVRYKLQNRHAPTKETVENL